LDLLTDEAQNRNVLTWIKSWDDIVFPEKEKFNQIKVEKQKNEVGAFFKRDFKSFD
jgi:hypothetical protein